MAKKYFVLLGTLILLTGILLYSQEHKQEEKVVPIKWKVLSTFARNTPVYQNGMERFAKDIKDISGENFEIEYYAAGEYKDIQMLDVFDAVSKGIVEMGFGISVYWAEDKIPGGEFMYSIPFGMNAKDMYAWLYRGGGMDLWKEMYEPFNIIPFAIGNTGGAMGGWFREEINARDIEGYFKNKKIRTMGMQAKVYEKLGAKTEWKSVKEALDDYKNNKMDVIIGLGPFSDSRFKFFRGPKFYYSPGWQEPGGVISLIINKKSFESLEPKLQKTIEIACANTYQYISNQFDSMNAIALKELQKEKDVIIREFPTDVLDKFRRLSTEVLEEEAKKSAQFDKVYRAFKKFKEENVNSGWGKIVDEAVYSETVSSNISETTALKFIEGLADSKYAKVTPKGNNSVVFSFSGVAAFGSWSSTLNPVLASEVARILKIIRDNSISIKWIRVEGHAATDGGDCSNWEISKKRANAVSELLTANGIDKSLIKVIAYGEDYPIIIPDDTEAKRSINRRVEIVIEF